MLFNQRGRQCPKFAIHICSLFNAHYHRGVWPPWCPTPFCSETLILWPRDPTLRTSRLQANSPAFFSSSPVLIIMKRLLFPFFFPRQGCWAAVLWMHSCHAGRTGQATLIPATFYHIWPPKPISGFDLGSGGLLSSTPCRTSRRRAKGCVPSEVSGKIVSSNRRISQRINIK